MSVIHYLETRNDVDFDTLTYYLAEKFPSLRYLKRDEYLYYYWLHGDSTRGVDFSRESKHLYELRNTALSNEGDYVLSNTISRFILSRHGGHLLDEEEEPLDRSFPFTSEEMKERQKQDVHLLMILLANGQEFAFFLAQRQVIFGPKAYAELKPYTDRYDELIRRIHGRMRHVWYEVPPEFEYGLIGQLENPQTGEIKLTKLLTNQVPYIVPKVHFILFEKNDRELIAVRREDFMKIKPEHWEMIDEYQFLAPVMPQAEWEALKQKAMSYDIFPDFW